MEAKLVVRQMQRLQALVSIAERLGYRVCHENLGGQGGGLCHFQNKKWLFIDLALATADNLKRLEESLVAGLSHTDAVSPDEPF